MASGSLGGWHPHFDVWLIFGALGVLYVTAVRRHLRRTGEATPRGRQVLFLVGVATFWLGSDWPVHDLAEGSLYSVHMAQHLLFTLVGALALVAGTPTWMARRLLAGRRIRRLVGGLSRPVPALLQANLVLVLSHWPLVVNTTVENHPLHFVAHAVLVASAILMWMPVASPLPEIRRLRAPVQMLYLFGQTILPTVPASFLTFARTPLYEVYVGLPRMFGLDVVTDQQMAGLVMKLAGGFYLWFVIAVIFFRWSGQSERDGEETVLYSDVEHELIDVPAGGR
ncbi:MAG: cytochrome c oxidase assembly protein [Acidimicrobiales bacterium]